MYYYSLLVTSQGEITTVRKNERVIYLAKSLRLSTSWKCYHRIGNDHKINKKVYNKNSKTIYKVVSNQRRIPRKEIKKLHTENKHFFEMMIN